MNLFSRKENQSEAGDFAYLQPNDCYIDVACQSLRPQCVIDAEVDYYQHYNACGGRVKHRWGEQVDKKVDQTRAQLLKYLGKSAGEYEVAFTLNTTYGINMVLHALPVGEYKRIVTSDIEHNSVLLPTLSVAQCNNLDRIVLSRNDDGSVVYDFTQLENAIVVLNSISNIDGRQCLNINDLARDVHARGGILCVDGAQAMVSQRATLSRLDFDCLFGSSHKMYGPSLGFVIIKKSLLKKCTPALIGGGMVSDVLKDSYTLINDDNQLYSRLEPGLQNWAGIMGFSKALEWLSADDRYTPALARAQEVYEGVKQLPGVIMTNATPSSTFAWYSKSADAHEIALMYSKSDIMVRSGYFCCHYYLQHVKNLPPLVRMSFGAHNTKEDVAKILDATATILTVLR
ncbi:MAG: aminotransferase class V-fold PLP-dependent enzyme [bacterium]|nr:aminotransferase class V-fold PLP-dependent enzyme [bacterium]